jgi:hypothetical protein
MSMTRCVQSAFVPAEQIELGTVGASHRFAASGRAPQET